MMQTKVKMWKVSAECITYCYFMNVYGWHVNNTFPVWFYVAIIIGDRPKFEYKTELIIYRGISVMYKLLVNSHPRYKISIIFGSIVWPFTQV